MFLITCLHGDCATPQFFVNPKGGKIILAVGLDLSEMQFNIVRANISNDDRIKGLVSNLSSEIGNLTQQQNESLRDKLVDFLSTESINNTLPEIKKLENVTDYLVIKCPSNHKNYIALGELSESEHKKVKEDGENK